jgi:hypothetical protein
LRAGVACVKVQFDFLGFCVQFVEFQTAGAKFGSKQLAAVWNTQVAVDMPAVENT